MIPKGRQLNVLMYARMINKGRQLDLHQLRLYTLRYRETTWCDIMYSRLTYTGGQLDVLEMYTRSIDKGRQLDLQEMKTFYFYTKGENLMWWNMH